MDAPWDRHDVVIDVELVRAVVDEQIPSLRGKSVRFQHEGWDSRAFLVDDAWIFRFPKRREVAERLRIEMALLPRVAPGFPLAIPRFEHVGASSPRYPYAFVGYRRLPGRILIDVEPATIDRARLGRALVPAMAALHGFDAAEAARLGVPASAPDDLADSAAEALAWLGELRSVVSADEIARAEAILRAPPPPYQGAPRLVHGDLAAEHLLVDEDGAVTGLIDWGDVTLGDPAIDLAGLFGVAEIPPADEALRGRVRFLTTCRAVGDLFYGIGDRRPEYVRTAQRLLRIATS